MNIKHFFAALIICLSVITSKAQNYYNEPYRGQIHFSPPQGWLNDPAGLAYYNGEYHFFYQYNPHATRWGLKHWGHAVSKNLLHWENLDIALYPNEFGARWTGSSIIDSTNVTGLSKNGKHPMLMFYTSRPAEATKRSQRLAYTYDGRTFHEYPYDIVPYYAKGNRDPHIIWHTPTKKWVMVLYINGPGSHRVDFLTSTNLLKWEKVSSIIGEQPAKENHLFECNDFFELAIDGNPKNKKWVLTGANGMYDIGTFDGKTFKQEYKKLHGIAGASLYAGKTYNYEPKGRRIDISWWKTNTHLAGMPFTQSMTLPAELKLINTPNGPRLTRTPIKEIEQLRSTTKNFGALTLNKNTKNPLAAINHELLEIRATAKLEKSANLKFDIRGVEISYDAATEILKVDTLEMEAPRFNKDLDLIIYTDRIGIEIFANNGLYYVPFAKNMDPKNNKISVSTNEKITFSNLDVYTLKRVWPNSVAAPTIAYNANFNLSVGIEITGASPKLGGGPLTPSIEKNVIHRVINISGVAGNKTGDRMAAKLAHPLDIAFDKEGNMYIAEDGNNSIKKMSNDGVVTHFAGSENKEGGNVDGSAKNARFQEPTGIAVHPITGDVYVTDAANNSIRKITAKGDVSTFAGSTNKEKGTTLGSPAQTRFSAPAGLVFDASGNLYVADRENHRILKYTASTNKFELYAGSTFGFADSDNPKTAKFWRPLGIDLDAAGNLYVADRRNYSIRKIEPNGKVSTIAGNQVNTGFVEGKGTASSLVDPIDVAVGADGYIYVSDFRDYRIIRIDKDNNVTSLVRSEKTGSTSGPLAYVSLNTPFGIKLGPDNNIYFAERNNHTVRMISLSAYTVSPALPEGLTLNPLTGAITGKPKAKSAEKTYTVKLNDGYGKFVATASFKLAVK